MFNILVSEHIKARKEEKGLTYEAISAKATVPLSTLHAYAQGTIKTPKDDVLVRIFAVLGDGPEVIKELRRKAAASTVEEAQLLSASTDQERMEAFASLMRANMAAVLEEYRLQAAAQQTEIIQHADARVETERQRFKARADEVLRQCNAENERTKAECAREIAANEKDCEQRMALTEKHYEARLASMKEHLGDMLKSEHEHNAELRERYVSSREYLKSSVRNLSAACIILVLTNVFFGAYAIFAYTTFDMADTSRGLHREAYSMGPVMLALSAVLIAVAVSRLFVLFIKRPKNKSE